METHQKSAAPGYKCVYWHNIVKTDPIVREYGEIWLHIQLFKLGQVNHKTYIYLIKTDDKTTNL